ncbi:MAG TPA: hypothetical protein VFU12_15335 [Glycomyces sp.]|nr:hypothetical protein [Glycomyces sp.]
MRHACFKAFAATGAAALLLTACNSGGDTDDGSGDTASQNPVYAEMSTWDACEVLDDLQPITEYMGIEGWGSTTAQGGEPGNSEIGNTFDPEAIGCGSSIVNFGENVVGNAGGELLVKIIPAEDEEQAAAVYEERAAAAEAESAEWTEAANQEFDAPWEQGNVISWVGDADQPFMRVIAHDGQWVFQIQLYHTQDFGIRNGGEPSLDFTDDELRQWLIETYLPEANHAVNDRIAEVQ